MTNPIATIKLNNGKKIVMKLRPEYAYNEVCSFISAATKGYYDNFAIQRIVPGSWVDVSYNAFFRKVHYINNYSVSEPIHIWYLIFDDLQGHN